MERDIQVPAANRGAKTVEQLLSAGLEAFARFGPERVTTRQLAKVAGVNSAAIGYYFGGKEGYYLEVVKYMLKERLLPVLHFFAETKKALDASDRDPATAAALLEQFLHGLAVQLLMNPDARFMASISSREHLHPTAAFDLIYEGSVLPLHGVLAELIGCAIGVPADGEEAIIRAHAILGQMLLFRIAATTICRRLAWDRITDERAEHIAAILVGMACRAIGLEPGGRKRNES